MKTNRALLSKLLTLLLTAAVLMAGPARAGEQVPFRGKADGAIVNAVPGPGGVELTVLATGQATQLGQFSRQEVLQFDPVAGTVTGTIVFTAANGDQLSGIVIGGFTSPTTAAGSYTFSGGTGRFIGASGSAAFSLTTPDGGAHFSVTFAGTLSSVGSNK